VLLIDANSLNQLVMRGMLLKLGFRVRTADNGSAALDHLQRETFDAVVLDSQLPPMDGLSVYCRIRAVPGCAELPVFVVALGADRESCPTGAVFDYLSKPVKFEDLQAALYRRVIGQGQGESADS
jgi:CheY-like chemotaxis protein